MTQYEYDLKNIEIKGQEWQMLKLAEEAAELASAILQWKNKDASFKNVEKEVADIKIALRYFQMMYDMNNVNKYIKRKEQRINRKVREQMKDIK